MTGTENKPDRLPDAVIPATPVSGRIIYRAEGVIHHLDHNGIDTIIETPMTNYYPNQPAISHALDP